MKILFTCGGTAGHVNPAVALARIFQERQPGSQVLFVGADGGMETRLVPKEGYRIDLGVLGVFYPRIINKSWRELPVMPKDFIPSLHIQGINIVWERSEKLSNLGDDIEYNIVASRAAQAALLKAEKEGLDNVDLTAIKNKPTPEPSDPSGSDGGSTGTDPGQGGSGGSSSTPDEEGGGGLGA